MANVQTRRTISINRSLFREAQTAALQRGVPLSQLTEEALRWVITQPVDRKAAFEREVEALKQKWGL